MEKLNPKAVWIFFFQFLGIGLVFILILGYFLFAFAQIVTEEMQKMERVELIFDYWQTIIIFLAVIWLFGSYGWAKLTCHFYRYELTNDGFRKEKGVIWKKYITISYDRIQNVDIYRGVLARILGLSDLHIQTAGMSASVSHYGWGKEAEGRLPGLSREIAEQLRNELIQRARQSKNQGL